MARSPIVYRLNDPGFTIYHRAALGGLAATIRSWGPSRLGVPDPLLYEEHRGWRGHLSNPDANSIEIFIDSTSITLRWSEPTTDCCALELLLKASFLRTKEGMIYLPGLGFGPDREDVLVAVHNAVSQTFLQHPKKRPGSGVGHVTLVDEEKQPQILTFRKVDRYSHQVAQGTNLLGNGWSVEGDELPEVASIPQSLLPGATSGASDLDARPEHAFLLHFLMVACPVFLIRSRKREAKTQNCLVVPDITDLRGFASRLLELGGGTIRCFNNTYDGRVVGGGEEAALRFLMDYRGTQKAERLGISNFQVFAMGKVAWDKNQQNRSWIARVDISEMLDHREFGVFEAAASYLGKVKWVKTKKGESFALPASPVPDLIASNLATGDHWCAHFRDLVAEKQDFLNISFRREGLRAMQNAIRDQKGADLLVIRRFQKAWEMTMGAMGARARRDGLDYSRLVEVERERIRNDLLRCKTSEQITGWLLQFMAKATREGTPSIFSEDAERFRDFIFNPRNADRLQNLLLFALVSYTSEDKRIPAQPDNQ